MENTFEYLIYGIYTNYTYESGVVCIDTGNNTTTETMTEDEFYNKYKSYSFSLSSFTYKSVSTNNKAPLYYFNIEFSSSVEGTISLPNVDDGVPFNIYDVEMTVRVDNSIKLENMVVVIYGKNVTKGSISIEIS